MPSTKGKTPLHPSKGVWNEISAWQPCRNSVGENPTANLEIKLCEVRLVKLESTSTLTRMDVLGLATQVVSKDPLSHMGQLKAVLKVYHPIVEPIG